MTTNNDPLSQAEERRVTLQDADLRKRQQQQQQGSTFFQHAASQAGEANQGRFGAIGTPQVIGKTPPVYPKLPASSPWSHDPVPDEPAFGVPIDIVERDQ